MTLKQRTSSSIRLNNSYNNNLILKMSQKIRIKLKSYDHQLVDKSAEKIVKAVKATALSLVVLFHCQHTSVFLL